jgi:tetratricopeptide (TPR) repeat protein
MKIMDRIEREAGRGRILVFALVGAAVLGAIAALPLYQTAQSSASPDSLPTRLHVNPDGSVGVSFQCQAGAAYQIYYANELTGSSGQAVWTLIADGIGVVTNGWTEWPDVGAAKRPYATGAKQGYYRVVPKPTPLAKTTSAASATTVSTNSTPTNSLAALKAMRRQEIAAITNLIAGGPAMESALAQKLAETPLTGEYILELTKSLAPFEQDWAKRLILEAVIGPKAGALKPKQLGRARLMLAGVYAGAQRYPEAIQQFLIVAQLRPSPLYGCEAWVCAGRIHRLQQNYVEARRCWEQAIQLTGAGRWPEEAQWMIGLSYLEERNHARALEEFRKLAESPDSGMFRAHGYFYMGEALRGLGRWQEAYAAYRKVIELDRDLPKRSPFGPLYSQAEKWARNGWAQIAPHLAQETKQTSSQGTAAKPETQP